MNKMLLINPPHHGSYRSKIMLGDSLALAAVSGEIIRNNWSTVVLDCMVHNWDLNTLKVNIKKHQPFDAVGITAMSNSCIELLKQIIKIILDIEPASYIFVGGHAPTLNYEKFLSLKIDALYLGDSLDKIPEILHYFKNCKIYSFKNNMSKNKKKICSPGIKIINAPLKDTYAYNVFARRDIKLSYALDHIVSIDTSKGCHGNCSFCTINFQYCSKWIPREIDNIKEELLYIKKKLPFAEQIRIVDANFLGGGEKYKQRAIQISKFMKELGFKFRIECRIDDIEPKLFSQLKYNGLVGVFTGIENGEQDVLNLLKKGITPLQILKAIKILHNNKISYTYGYMTISPITNLDNIYNNIEFLKRIKYGIRFKHFFNSLIIQRNDIFDVALPIKSFEKKVGFKPAFEVCSKLLHFNEICLDSFLEVYELEHTIGTWIERGKESGDNYFWLKDKVFSNLCIQTFISILENIIELPNHKNKLKKLASEEMTIFKENLYPILLEIKHHGLNNNVKLKILEEKTFS